MAVKGLRIHSLKPASRGDKSRATTVQDACTRGIIHPRETIKRIVITLEGDEGKAEITLIDGEIVTIPISDFIAYEADSP